MTKIPIALTYGRHQQQENDTKLVFAVHSFVCGFYTYTNNELIYLPEIEWNASGGIAKFIKGTLVITFDDEFPKRVEIPYRIIEGIVISTQPPALTLTLWEAPRLFEVEDQSLTQQMASFGIQPRTKTPPRTRLHELPHSTRSHRVICGQSLVYRLVVSSVEFAERTKRLMDMDIFAISNYKFPQPSVHEPRSLVEGLESFNKAIKKHAEAVPFSVLYQLEALVKNGFLLPWTVETLLVRMVSKAKAKRGILMEDVAQVSSIAHVYRSYLTTG